MRTGWQVQPGGGPWTEMKAPWQQYGYLRIKIAGEEMSTEHKKNCCTMSRIYRAQQRSPYVARIRSMIFGLDYKYELRV